MNKNSFTQKVLAAGFAGLLLTSFGPVAHARMLGTQPVKRTKGATVLTPPLAERMLASNSWVRVFRNARI
nr:hypothetical protein [Corynebacterium auriscanis]